MCVRKSGVGVVLPGVSRFRILMPPLSRPTGVCVRNRRGPLAVQGVRAIRMCPGRACHDIRRAPDRRLPALSGSHTAGLRMPGHARTAKHGASTAVSRRYPFSFACHGIQDAHTTRAAIKTPTHPTSRHTYWPITLTAGATNMERNNKNSVHAQQHAPDLLCRAPRGIRHKQA